MTLAGRICPKCGAQVPLDAPRGQCSACLLESGLGDGPDEDLGQAGDKLGGGLDAEAGLRSFGEYELLNEIGRGGQGVVYRARQKTLNRLVALKAVMLGPWTSEAHLKRFRLEAEAIAALDHSGIVPIYEIGEEEGCCFFTMKLIEGGRLDETLKQGLWAPRRTAVVLASLARTVHYAHQRGVLHRDIKPANVLLDEAGQPHLTDFGLAKLLEGESSMTRTVDVLGTPNYMPPEQASGRARQLTTAADIYALGAVCYEMLTGQPPFTGATPAEVLRRVEEREPRRPSLLNPAVDADLETICLKCLEKDPDKRYASALALAEDAERYLNGQPIQARQVGGAERFWRWCRRNPKVAGLGSLAVLLLVTLTVGSTIAAWRIQRERQRALQAEQAAKNELWGSYLAEARAVRLGGLAGRRAQSLKAIAAAAKMKPSLELRNEAVAALALIDIDTPVRWYPADPGGGFDHAIPDSSFERFAVCHDGGGVTVHRVDNGQIIATFPTPGWHGGRVNFSPDAHYLQAQFSGGGVFVWDLTQPEAAPFTNYPAAPDGQATVAFSPDSHLLALAGKDGRVHFYNVSDWRELPGIELGAVGLWMELDPASQRLAILITNGVQIWDLKRLERYATFAYSSDGTILHWHPNGRLLAVGYSNGDLLLWDTATGRNRPLPGHTQYINGLAFDLQGEFLASCSWDGTSRFWDPQSGVQIFWSQQAGPFCSGGGGQWLAFLPEQGDVGAWRVLRSEVFRTVTSPQAPLGALNGVDIDATGRLMAFSEKTAWHLWDLQRNVELASAVSQWGSWPLFAPGGRFVITVTPDAILRWPLGSTNEGTGVHIGQPEILASAPGSQFQRACLSPDGELLVVAGHFKTLMIDLTKSSGALEIAQGQRQSFVSLSQDKRLVALASYYGIGATVWDARSGKLVVHLVTNQNAQVCFHPDGQTLVTATARECIFWDTNSWTARKHLPLELSGVVPATIGFSRDGRLLAVAVPRRQIKLLDGRTGQELATLTAPVPHNLESFTFSGDSHYLAAHTPAGVVHLWDLQKLRQGLAAIGLDW